MSATLPRTSCIDLTGLSPEHRRIIGEALDLYMRVLIGQFEAPLELNERKYPETCGLVERCKGHTTPALTLVWGDKRPGIGNPDVHEDAKEAHDLRDVILCDSLRTATRFTASVLPEVRISHNPDDAL